MEKKSRSGQTKGIPITAIVTNIEKDCYFTKIKVKNRDKRPEAQGLEGKIVKIENRKTDSFESPLVPGQIIRLIYLTRKSLRGEYKDSELNIPYEVIDNRGRTIYRQYHKRPKQDILNKLENAEIKEDQ